MALNQSQLCNVVNNAKCCIGDKALELLDKEQKGHNTSCCFEELLWMSRAIKILEDYTVVGTLTSTPAVNACGQTNTEVRFAPTPPLVTFQIISLIYNGSPVVVGLNFSTLLLAMDDIVAALTAATGVTWSYTQLSEWEFFLCAPYTQNGDTVDITIEVFSEALLGDVVMHVILAGGVAPEPPIYRTAADNCLTAQQIAKLSGKFCRIKVKRPQNIERSIDVELRDSIIDIELRD